MPIPVMTTPTFLLAGREEKHGEKALLFYPALSVLKVVEGSVKKQRKVDAGKYGERGEHNWGVKHPKTG
jgi:hypothetical protein